MKILLKQLLLLLFITGILTSLFTYTGINIYISIGISLLLQFVIYHGYLYIVESLTLIKFKQIELKKIAEYSYQVAEVTCPCSSQHKQVIPIRLNTDNQYTCKDCNKLIKVYVNIDTALATEPIIQTDIQKITPPLNNNDTR